MPIYLFKAVTDKSVGAEILNAILFIVENKEGLGFYNISNRIESIVYLRPDLFFLLMIDDKIYDAERNDKHDDYPEKYSFPDAANYHRLSSEIDMELLFYKAIPASLVITIIIISTERPYMHPLQISPGDVLMIEAELAFLIFIIIGLKGAE